MPYHTPIAKHFILCHPAQLVQHSGQLVPQCFIDPGVALNHHIPFQQPPDGSVIKTTEMLALNFYNAFYSGGGTPRGVGQAKAAVFFILVAVIGLIQLQATRKKEVQQ